MKSATYENAGRIKLPSSGKAPIASAANVQRRIWGVHGTSLSLRGCWIR